MSPVQLEDTWNGYGFDMRDKILHILDPVNTRAKEATYVAKHGATIELMFDGMAQAGGCSEVRGGHWIQQSGTFASTTTCTRRVQSKLLMFKECTDIL